MHFAHACCFCSVSLLHILLHNLVFLSTATRSAIPFKLLANLFLHLSHLQTGGLDCSPCDKKSTTHSTLINDRAIVLVILCTYNIKLHYNM